MNQSVRHLTRCVSCTAALRRYYIDIISTLQRHVYKSRNIYELLTAKLECLTRTIPPEALIASLICQICPHGIDIKISSREGCSLGLREHFRY